MKTLKIAAVMALASLSVNAQNLSADKVPTKVMADFQKNYPQAKDIEWEMKGNYLQVEFDLGRYDHEISYDNAGKVVKVEKEINPTELPSNVTSAIKQKYPDYKIDQAEMRQADNKTSYKVEIEQGWFKERNLVLDSNGKLISDLED